jgi:hypothetical protein
MRRERDPPHPDDCRDVEQDEVPRPQRLFEGHFAYPTPAEKERRMKMIGLALVAAGVAGFLLLRPDSRRWESAGAAVTGVVIVLIPRRKR